MQPSNLLYEGEANIYLQGKNALIATDPNNKSQMAYSIGSLNSSLNIQDYRRIPSQAAKQALSGEDGLYFADTFNQPAFAQVTLEGTTVNIILRESEKAENAPILWIGVFNENEMSVQPTRWEFLRSIDDRQTAFVALIVQDHSVVEE